MLVRTNKGPYRRPSLIQFPKLFSSQRDEYMAKLSSSQRDKYVAESLFGAEIRSILYEHVFLQDIYVRTVSAVYDNNRSYFIVQVRFL